MGAYIRQHHLALLCLFLILAGGTAWALERNSVRSKHIVNGQVRGPDVAEKTLDDVARVAYADVSSDGDVTQARGIRQSDVEVGTSDTYCFEGLPFKPRGAVTAIDYSEASIEDDELHVDMGTVAECSQNNQAFVWAPNGPAGFYILFYR